MLKKIFSIVLCILLIFSMGACKNKDESPKNNEHIIISAIVKANFIGEEGLTDEIVTSLEDIQEEKDISIRFLEVADDSNYSVIIEEAVNEGASLVLMTESNKEARNAVLEASEQYPKVKFAIFDAALENENLESAVFSNEESAFLAGYVASKSTKTKNIGFVYVKDDEKAELYKSGYIAGARYADKDVEVEVALLDEDPSISDGYDATKNLIEEKKVDIVYHFADVAGRGVIEASEEFNIYAIGSEKDQSYLSSKHVLASTVKNINLPLKSMVDEAINGKFNKKIMYYGLSNEGVDLKDRAGNLNSQLVKDINTIKEDIKNKKIKPPQNQDQLNEFLETL